MNLRIHDLLLVNQQISAPPPPQPQPHIAHTQGGVAYIVNPQPVLMTTPNVVIIKNAHTFDPYPEYCPKCQTIVTTHRDWVFGTCAWTVIVLSLIFWPLLFLLCTSSSKDAYHYCPCCLTLLAIKRR
ncbi:unnamed protein product [Cylicostephanus goldi]|uniref:LITAF domain-containing protein n=1 Tax=Cylicostephanus goldi TaxID=71465 RepID=A0A3P6SWA8_CYLGO|nr:unnamed protein product [Cylicostephanus goldi]